MPLPESIRGVKRRRPDIREAEVLQSPDYPTLSLAMRLMISSGRQRGQAAPKTGTSFTQISRAIKRPILRIFKHHALKALRKVVKKAKTFEVQKTLKKLKEARREDPESDVTKDLGAQVEILKHLGYDQLAHSALMTKLKKDKTLSADPSIQAISVELASNQVSPRAPGTPTAKVQSRILSSKVLASEVVSIVETLRTFLQHYVGSEDIGEATDNPHASPSTSKRRRRTGTGHDKGAFLSKDSIVNPSGEGSHGGNRNTSGNEAIAAVNDDWESGTVGAPPGSDGSVVGSADDRDTSSDDSDDVAFGQGSSDEGDVPSENFESKKPQPHGTKGQSEFLPSLSVGFTRCDSGSEFSDSETKLADGIKKNRRGQRARRAIWEKKFGKNANHIMKQRQRLPGSGREVDRRSEKGNSSSQPHRTLTQSHAPSRGHEQVRWPPPGGSEGIKSSDSTKGQSGRLQRRGDLRGNQGERPLHPSWEAKRKQKAANIVASQGTKIVFSES
ncbi:Bud-site selection protein [Lanmaoa asiatica]|nr:Bud-site selection protein [Lanmaoa asiatica]